MSSLNAQLHSWKIIFLTYCFGVICFLVGQDTVLSQTKITNPLDITRSDPLIPSGYGKRELTSFEKYRIEKAIAQLNQTAHKELDRGKIDRAFELWYRHLRLTSIIDTDAEIKALGKIGAIAWQENRGTDVRNIAERLITIQKKITAKKPLSSSLLTKLAKAYQQVRYLHKAINIYQQLLVNSKKADDLIAEQKNLEILGELYLARFDYQEAADIYQELLDLATIINQKSEPTNKEEVYLETLIDIYDRTAQTDKAINIKKRLIEQYSATQQINKILPIKMAIAQDYETLKQLDKAIETYNQAFSLASKNQKLAIASDTLTRLAELYQQSDRTDDAIRAYAKLIKVQQQSYNHYGLINTYDILGKIYLKLNQKSQAKQYFQRGLDLAKSLNYKVDYFNYQIEHIK